nr:WYL domain-containing protein [uncultured Ruegeria sp.]
MSFEKARDILRLADMAMSRHMGVSLREIEEEFGVAKRTAQRMTQALHEIFGDSVSVNDADPDRIRRWKITSSALAGLHLNGAEELEAIEVALSRLDEPGDVRQRQALQALRDRLLAALPSAKARIAETDAEAALEAFGMAARPGPVAYADREVVEAIAKAIRGFNVMRIVYGGEVRLVEPYGVLLGARRYLVARQPAKGNNLRHFRLDRIEDAEVTKDWFERAPDFDLSSYAEAAFGSYHNPDQVTEVVWIFSKAAADRAANWQFHPKQVVKRLGDGRLEVRFRAGGWLEMAWHLYQWGDEVEVVSPKALRDLVHVARRSDFEALP